MKSNSGGILYVLLVILCPLRYCDDSEDYEDQKRKVENKGQLEVRAVYINCEPDDQHLDSDTTRFEREELYKHNALRDCNKKVALTLKMTDAVGQDLEDEFVPIDHVLEGAAKRRVRLLNPYVLRLQRQLPLQAYTLRRMETVNAVLTDRGKSTSELYNNKKRSERHTDDVLNELMDSAVFGPAFSLEHDDPARRSYSIKLPYARSLLHNMSTTDMPTAASKILKQISLDDDNHILLERVKRYEQELNEYSMFNNQTLQQLDESSFLVNELPDRSNTRRKAKDTSDMYGTSDNKHIAHSYEKRFQNNPKQKRKKSVAHPDLENSETNQVVYVTAKTNANQQLLNDATPLDDFSDADLDSQRDVQRNKEVHIRRTFSDNPNRRIISEERAFILYEIGEPHLWFNAHVQLFQKLSSPEGKTIWNDLTKGKPAIVGATDHEWSNEDMNLRYRPAEWLGKNDFTLPIKNLCLLKPLSDTENVNQSYNETNYPGLRKSDALDTEEYMVVPVEDVVELGAGGEALIKADDTVAVNASQTSTTANNTQPNLDRRRRRVEVRVARALYGDAENFAIATRGSEQFLTLPHRRPHHAQIDLEVQADDNQLVRVGSSGCIGQIVSDSTRKARSILTIQAVNTGLASARFRVVARDCGPELAGLIADEGGAGAGAGPVLLPPRHTRRLRIELPAELQAPVAHCSVALLNDNDDSVAVRDIAIKKDDRCFCVWHCDCVCLSDDPKLLCREMSPTLQAAAGLPVREHPRLVRSVRYPNRTCINITTSVFGVICLLLFLGFLKACIGLKCKCVAVYGTSVILQVPRRLDKYYEPQLKSRPVQYDCVGWPVHPDTGRRSVLPISKSMLFLLNTIFFLVLPFAAVVNGARNITARFTRCRREVSSMRCSDNANKCYSSDIQCGELQLRRRRHTALQRWMTPEAEEFSGNIWHGALTQLRGASLEGLKGQQAAAAAAQMQPLLPKGSRSQTERRYAEPPREPPSPADSERDDTAYVLTQMQKSRESLAAAPRMTSTAVQSDRKYARKGSSESPSTKTRKQ